MSTSIQQRADEAHRRARDALSDALDAYAELKVVLPDVVFANDEEVLVRMLEAIFARWRGNGGSAKQPRIKFSAAVELVARDSAHSGPPTAEEMVDWARRHPEIFPDGLTIAQAQYVLDDPDGDFEVVRELK